MSLGETQTRKRAWSEERTLNCAGVVRSLDNSVLRSEKRRKSGLESSDLDSLLGYGLRPTASRFPFSDFRM